MFGEIPTDSLNKISPVSTFSSIKKVVTPDSFSPSINAQFMGAAPLYFGNKEACRLKVPLLGSVKIDGGKMRKATTTKRSAFNFSKPEHIDFKRCWSLENLRLLPAMENIKKHNKLFKPFQPALKI